MDEKMVQGYNTQQPEQAHWFPLHTIISTFANEHKIQDV